MTTAAIFVPAGTEPEYKSMKVLCMVAAVDDDPESPIAAKVTLKLWYITSTPGLILSPPETTRNCTACVQWYDKYGVHLHGPRQLSESHTQLCGALNDMAQPVSQLIAILRCLMPSCCAVQAAAELDTSTKLPADAATQQPAQLVVGSLDINQGAVLPAEDLVGRLPTVSGWLHSTLVLSLVVPGFDTTLSRILRGQWVASPTRQAWKLYPGSIAGAAAHCLAIPGYNRPGQDFNTISRSPLSKEGLPSYIREYRPFLAT